MISGSREFTEVGALMSYGPSFPEMFRRAAVYVDADLPVEQPTKFVVNVKTAKALGITLPPSLLLRADHTLE
jgi:putative ABC transport system substrate-binding protein